MYSHGIFDGDIPHILRGDEDILFLVGLVGCVDLQVYKHDVAAPDKMKTYHHPHTDASVDSVHEDVELV